MPDKKTYKQINGTTRVGDFLRSLGKKETWSKVLDVTGDVVTGDFGGAVKTILRGSNELTDEQRQFALRLLESDVKENEEVTKRWQFDMSSDSWLSKNVRPLVLCFLTFMIILISFIDSFVPDVTLSIEWISLYKTILMTVYVAYFGGRSYEKTKKL